jgi:transposase
VGYKDEKIKLLEQTIEELQKGRIEDQIIKKQQQKTIEKQQETIEELTERVSNLEHSQALNSSNSSKPPSSDGLKKTNRTQSQREKSNKKSGGQPGHKGATLQQVEDPDIIERREINACPHCNTDLFNEPVIDICRKQIIDIPKEITPIVTEHQYEIKCCPGCQKKVYIQNDEAPVQYGPNIKTAVSYFGIYNLIPENRIIGIMNNFFGIALSSGTIGNIYKACFEGVKPIAEKIEEELIISPVKGADETGLRVAGRLHWVHALCDDKRVHYRLSEKRGDIKECLTGVVVHDSFVSYDRLEGVQHSLCNAHILRELKAVEEIDKELWARKMARLLRFGNRVSKENRQVINAKWLEKYRKLFDQIVDEAIGFYESLGVLKKSARGRDRRRIGHNLALRLKNKADYILRFLTDSEVPFTNNLAECAVRMIKVKQKVSGCFRTFDGANKFLTVRSFTATAQKQGVKPLDALASIFHGTPISLI